MAFLRSPLFFFYFYFYGRPRLTVCGRGILSVGEVVVAVVGIGGGGGKRRVDHIAHPGTKMMSSGTAARHSSAPTNFVSPCPFRRTASRSCARIVYSAHHRRWWMSKLSSDLYIAHCLRWILCVLPPGIFSSWIVSPTLQPPEPLFKMFFFSSFCGCRFRGRAGRIGAAGSAGPPGSNGSAPLPVASRPIPIAGAAGARPARAIRNPTATHPTSSPLRRRPTRPWRLPSLAARP